MLLHYYYSPKFMLLNDLSFFKHPLPCDIFEDEGKFFWDCAFFLEVVFLISAYLFLDCINDAFDS